MSINVPSIGDIVMSPHDKFRDADGVEVFDLLEQNDYGGDIILIDENLHPLLYATKFSGEDSEVDLTFATVSKSPDAPTTEGLLSYVNDGNIDITEYAFFATHGDVMYLEVDLGSVFLASGVHVWRYYLGDRTYYDTKVEVSEDGVTWLTVFDSDTEGTYVESEDGRLFLFDETAIRYIRDYASSNSLSDFAHWVEIKAILEAVVALPNMTPPVGSSLRYKTVADLT